ncbi:anaphase-promoting complex subunit 5-domain-containing protein [Delphinella strobiligena]|nr:anaphase-promoting complex subunit 5-domain-containing protein [Delphinella strobiligena]
MSRFLTPSKVCLLVLVQFYRDGSILLKSAIPILSFISSHIIRSPLDQAKTQHGLSPASLKDFEDLLSSRESARPGRSLYDIFLGQLWELHNIVTFSDFLQDLTTITQPSPDGAGSSKLICSPTSPIGQFTRRCHLESVRLQFSDAYQLWENFVLFREPTKPAYLLRNPDSPYARDVPNAAAANLLLPEEPTASAILVDRLAKRQHTSATPSSQDDVEKAIHFQLSKLQKYGTRVPDEIKEHLRLMTGEGGSVPSEMHFINFFDAWRSGAYNNAIDLLHRYFDYTMEGHHMEKTIKTYHQYALLHLAVLHADFGCYGEAISAMNECIATARENQDARCLHFSLSWLAHLRKAYPEFAQLESGMGGNDIAGSESDIVTFLQQKAVENKDWATLSSSLLTQAEATIESGDNIAKALEQVYQSSYLNNTYNISNMIPSELRVHSAVFNRLGQASLAEQYCSTMHRIHGSTASKPDLLNTVLQAAYMRATAGKYEEALEMLRQNNPAPLKTLRLDQTFLAFVGMVQLRRALHRNELWAAEQYLRQVKPIRKSADAGIVFETHVLEIELLFRKGELTEAFNYISDRIDEVKKAESVDILQRIKLLILKARVFAQAGVPEKGFSIVLRAASSAHRALLLPTMWEAVDALCVILIDLGEFAAVRSLIDAVMPQVLEGGNEYLIASLYNLLTDAYVGLAGHECEEGSKERDGHINSALLYVERAKEAYTQVEDLDGILSTIAKKATLYGYRGEEALAEEMEGLYAHVVEEAEKRLEEILGRGL